MSDPKKKTQPPNGVKRKLILEKEFKIRNSPLTDRFESNEDIKVIYNLFAVIFISLFTNTIIDDYTKTGEVHFGLRLIIRGFNKFWLVFVFWGGFNLLGHGVYYCLRLWAETRSFLSPKKYHIWDNFWIGVLILYYISSLYGLQRIITIFGFAPGSAAVLCLEQVRLLMKQHSFVRTIAPQVLVYKPHSDTKLKLPSLFHFIYFTFAPTLLYRDEYPRSQTIRWGFVMYSLLEIFGIIFLLSLVIERFLIPPFEDFCLRKFSTSEIFVPVVGNLFPGILFVLCGFYSVLHCAQNAFGEMLRFGDRMFYREWWTSRSLSEYYRMWNVVVHDWLFTYIYKDMYEIVLPKNKSAAKITVFVISAIVHEWLMSNVLDLFLPIQFAQFFIAGAVLTLLNILDLPVGNLVVWYALVMGSGMQVNLYTMEFIARKNCPMDLNYTNYEFLKPRFLTCDCIK